MYGFLLEISLFISLGILIYMLALVIPRVDETEEATHTHGRLDRLLEKLPLQAIDERLNGLFEKTLRRLRVFLFRADHVIDERLEKLKKAGIREKGIDLFEKINNDTKE